MITQQPVLVAHNWNAKDYAKGNRIDAAAQLLREKKINLKNKIVFDIGSGTGNISSYMACIGASSVLGIDASLNMINWSNSQHGYTKNLSFKQCFAENFSPAAKGDLVTLFNCLDWIKNENKPLVLQKCYESLQPGGELIGNIRTAEDGLSISLSMLEKILPQLKKIAPTLKKEDILQSSGSGSSYLTRTQLNSILKKIGFTQISLETKSLNYTFRDYNELYAFERPIMMSRPFMQSLDPKIREEILKLYVHELFKTLKYVREDDDNEDDHYGTPETQRMIIHSLDDHYINPNDRTTVIHCFKGTASKL